MAFIITYIEVALNIPGKLIGWHFLMRSLSLEKPQKKRIDLHRFYMFEF